MDFFQEKKDWNVILKKQKEGFVREEILSPLLYKLGYSHEQIHRDTNLVHPFVSIGSKQRKVHIIPDYLLQVEKNYAWVLEAKSPQTQNLNQAKEQLYSYAMHPDIRVSYYALCNGHRFMLFHVSEKEPILDFPLPELKQHWKELQRRLSPKSFQKKLKTMQEEAPLELKEEFDYRNRPILEEIPVRRQASPIHFGVHGQFTRQSWNVVREYIEHFTQPGDLVVDPFAGSGVTAIEALLTGRKAITMDTNPHSVFLIRSLLEPVSLSEFLKQGEQIIAQFQKMRPRTPKEVDRTLMQYPYPKDILLTAMGSKVRQVDFVHQLFSPEQLAELALLKSLIDKVQNKSIRDSLLIAFSSTLTKINLTYHPSTKRSENAGNAAPFIYYCYRIAPEPVFLDTIQVFQQKVQKVMKAKNSIREQGGFDRRKDIQVESGSARFLSPFVKPQSVDFIYTDPPYGSKIKYLDLSLMWTSWLNLKVYEHDYEEEAIEGGKTHKTYEQYAKLLKESIEEMYKALKFDRWLCFVFSHKEPKYWDLIRNSCEQVGFEYVGSVRQSNGQTSFKKRKNPFSVLSGQLILYFRKVLSPQFLQRRKLEKDRVYTLIIREVQKMIAWGHGATLEDIYSRLIIRGLEEGFLDVLATDYRNFDPILRKEFDYDDQEKKYYIRGKFQDRIPLKLRIRYYVISYLKRKGLEGIEPTTDDIILDLMPKLKNGDTPEDQTILEILGEVAYPLDDGKWVLQEGRKQTTFPEGRSFAYDPKREYEK